MSAQQPSINSNNDFVQIYRPDQSRAQQQQVKLATKPTQNESDEWQNLHIKEKPVLWTIRQPSKILHTPFKVA